jgi:hypothetical protein
MDSRPIDTLSSVVKDGEPWHGSFQAHVPFRAIVGLVLDEFTALQFASLSRAAEVCGDLTMWFADAGYGEHAWPRGELAALRTIRVGSYDEYQRTHAELTRVTNVALWSPSGSWAAVIMTEWFAVAGGTEIFGVEFEASWPPWPHGPTEGDAVGFGGQGEMFVKEMKRALNEPARLLPILTNTYGERNAHELLASA